MSQEEFGWRLKRVEEIKKELGVWYQRVSCPQIRELGASIIRRRLAQVVKPLVAAGITR